LFDRNAKELFPQALPDVTGAPLYSMTNPDQNR
jgi:hypothetical protein